jgi:putative hydrolase of HD superfamily
VNSESFTQQIEFLIELDKLKSVYRRSYVLGTDRNENDAEHSWHLGMSTLILAEYVNTETDIFRVMKMVLIHDIVEIDAGDTFCYDQDEGSAEREKNAANRVFGLLPETQANELLDLWEEFVLGESPESKFARSLDRLMPLLHNYYSEGKAWREYGITRNQVLRRNSHIQEGSEELWRFAKKVIDRAVEKGYLYP